jgi:primosomal protein N' (replication factor Y)
METLVSVGDKVRVTLHGRRVGGWIIALGEHGSEGFDDLPLEKLAFLTKHSGHAVVAHLVPLALDVADQYCGPRRAVLQSASSPRVTRSQGRPRHGNITAPQDVVSSVLQSHSNTTTQSKSMVHVVTIPPLESVLSLVAVLAQKGPVLVVCPTVRMAVLGAASLRRRGCSVALMPDDWDQGLDGVDVAIGARSAVWAPLANISSVVIVDEHDDSLKEERVPTWHGRDVAIQRAQREEVACYVCSPAPSVESLSMVNDGRAEHIEVLSEDGWPRIDVVDLNEVPVVGSLASSEMLQLVRQREQSVLCILNTKGKARLLVCSTCRAVARCERCQSAMSSEDPRVLHCSLCDTTTDAVCAQCGRTSFRVLRSGIGRLREEMEKASGRSVIEVDASTDIFDVSQGGVYIGTEALLHRVTGAHHVVFLDFDSELLAPRVTASRDALSLVIRASRVVGREGSVILQTRNRNHDLLVALAHVHTTPTALSGWQTKDLQLRELLHLTPFVSLARVRLDAGLDVQTVFADDNVTWAHEKENTYLVRSSDEVVLRDALQRARQSHGREIRVDVAPVRY